MDEDRSNVNNYEPREEITSNDQASLNGDMTDEAGKRQKIQKEELNKLVNLLIPKRL